LSTCKCATGALAIQGSGECGVPAVRLFDFDHSSAHQERVPTLGWQWRKWGCGTVWTGRVLKH
jgi:hypothetical protein